MSRPARRRLPFSTESLDDDSLDEQSVDERGAELEIKLHQTILQSERAVLEVQFIRVQLALFNYRNPRGPAAPAVHPLVEQFRCDVEVHKGYSLALGQLLGLGRGTQGVWRESQELQAASFHYRQNMLLSGPTGSGKTVTSILPAIFNTYYAAAPNADITLVISPLIVTVVNLVSDINDKTNDGFAWYLGGRGGSDPELPAASSNYNLSGAGSVYAALVAGADTQAMVARLNEGGGRLGAVVVVTAEQLTMKGAKYPECESFRMGLCHLIRLSKVRIIWDEVHLIYFALYRTSSSLLTTVLAGLRRVNPAAPPPIIALSSTARPRKVTATMDAVSGGDRNAWIEKRLPLGNLNQRRVTLMDTIVSPTHSHQLQIVFDYLHANWVPYNGTFHDKDRFLILTITKRSAEMKVRLINEQFRDFGLAVVYHAGLHPTEREANLKQLEGPGYRILVGTHDSLNHGLDKKYLWGCVEIDNPAAAVELHDQGMGRAGRADRTRNSFCITVQNWWTLNRGAFRCSDNPSEMVANMVQLMLDLSEDGCCHAKIMLRLESPGPDDCRGCAFCTPALRHHERRRAAMFDGSGTARQFMLRLSTQQKSSGQDVSYKRAVELFQIDAAGLDDQEGVRRWRTLIKHGYLLPWLDVQERFSRKTLKTARSSVLRLSLPLTHVHNVLHGTQSVLVPGVS